MLIVICSASGTDWRERRDKEGEEGIQHCVWAYNRAETQRTGTLPQIKKVWQHLTLWLTINSDSDYRTDANIQIGEI